LLSHNYDGIKHQSSPKVMFPPNHHLFSVNFFILFTGCCLHPPIETSKQISSFACKPRELKKVVFIMPARFVLFLAGSAWWVGPAQNGCFDGQKEKMFSFTLPNRLPFLNVILTKTAQCCLP